MRRTFVCNHTVYMCCTFVCNHTVYMCCTFVCNNTVYMRRTFVYSYTVCVCCTFVCNNAVYMRHTFVHSYTVCMCCTFVYRFTAYIHMLYICWCNHFSLFVITTPWLWISVHKMFCCYILQTCFSSWCLESLWNCKCFTLSIICSTFLYFYGTSSRLRSGLRCEVKQLAESNTRQIYI